MSGEKLDVDYDKIREMVCNEDCTLNHYLNHLLMNLIQM